MELSRNQYCVNRITFLQDKEVKCVQVNVMSIQKESVNLLLYKLHFFHHLLF